jgi:subtilisin family serine protease
MSNGAREYEHAGISAVYLTVQERLALLASGKIKMAEPIKRMSKNAVSLNPKSWGLDRLDQPNLPLNRSFSYPDSGGKGVIAYIIDTGIDGGHKEFSGRIATGFSAIADGRGTFDCEGHGTHVAATVGGTQYGVAKKVLLSAVRVLDCYGSGSNESVIAGVDFVLSQRKKYPYLPMVANMSLGGSVDAALDAAVAKLATARVFIAVAAGNSGESACLSSPARVPSAFTVAATDQNDNKAVFSNFGSCVDAYGPGVDIVSAAPNQGNASLSGTSMASPHVAGIAALIVGLNGSFTTEQTAARIRALSLKAKVKSVGSTLNENKLVQVAPN